VTIQPVPNSGVEVVGDVEPGVFALNHLAEEVRVDLEDPIHDQLAEEVRVDLEDPMRDLYLFRSC